MREKKKIAVGQQGSGGAKQSGGKAIVVRTVQVPLKVKQAIDRSVDSAVKRYSK